MSKSNVKRDVKKKGSKKNKKKKLRVVLIIEVALLLLAIAVLFFVFFLKSKFNNLDKTDKLTHEEAGVSEEVLEEIKKEEREFEEGKQRYKKRYETIVLYGVDSRKNALHEGTNSDVMIICAIDNEKKQIRLLSVYRDTYMDNGSEDGNVLLKRANSAYLYGYQRSIRMLNRNLDLDVQSYVTASFAAVTKAVEAFGGIEVEITDKEARQINRYLGETASVAKVKANFLSKGGTVLLDGAQATTYARIRKGVGDDYSRANRQRIVIKKLFEKAKQFDLLKLNRAIDEVLPYISTNLDNTEILNYMKNLVTYDIVDTKAFPFDFTATRVGKAAVLVPINLKKNVEQVHAYLYPDKETSYETSELVNTISNVIMNKTGVNDNTPKIEIGQYYNGEDANKVGNKSSSN